jgi:predicted permease
MIRRCRHPEEDLDAELRFDFEERVAAKMRSGLDKAEARRAARLEFGGIEQVKEECRDARAFAFLDSLRQDSRFALRMFGRHLGFTAVAVITLGLGIGINAAVFTVTDATLFKAFPLVQRNDRLVYMTSSHGCCVSYPDFEDWRAQAKSFKGMAIVHGTSVVLTDRGGFPERHDATEVSADTFRLAGVSPLLGRDFTASDEIPGASPTAILRYGFWERRFAKDPAIVGKTVRIGSVLTTVIGVMPRGFSFPQNQDLWVPLVKTPRVLNREDRGTWFVFGRMRDDATVASVRTEMQAIGERLESEWPAIEKGFPPIVTTFDEFFIGPNATLIYKTMWGAVGFVLLIACANLANLLLARGMNRSREISVRIAVGAGRWRMIRQLLIESTILSALGGFLGLSIARLGAHLYGLAASGAAISDETPGGWFDHVLEYSMDYRVVAYLVAISIATGLLFGLAPALRLSKLDVNAGLKDGSHGAAGGAHGRRLAALLIVGEMALAVVLLAGAGVMVQSFRKAYTADAGFEKDHILTALITLPPSRYGQIDAQAAFFDRLIERVNAIPGVESAAMTSDLPGWNTRTLPYELSGAPDDADLQAGRRPRVMGMEIGPAWFHTLGARIRAGREFEPTDGAGEIPVAIVNERFASRHWPGQNAIGKRFRVFRGTVPGPWLTVIGIAPNISQSAATGEDFDPVVYFPWLQNPTTGMWVTARTRVPPGNIANAFRREVHALDSELPIDAGPVPLTQRFAPVWQYRGFTAVLFLVFAGFALLLASIGLYAVTAHAVSRRMEEMGIRMALGASARDVRELVVRQGMVPVGIGLAVGLAGAVAVNRLLESQLARVSPADPLTLTLTAAVLIVAATMGCLIPARRATRVDPIMALRHE